MLVTLLDLFEERLKQCRAIAKERGDGGYTTETAIVVGVLVAIAIAAGVILTAKVLAKVESIDLG